MLELNLDPTEQMKYYECGDFPFNFYLTNLDPPVSALAAQKLILDWMDNMPDGKVANWVASLAWNGTCKLCRHLDTCSNNSIFRQGATTFGGRQADWIRCSPTPST